MFIIIIFLSYIQTELDIKLDCGGQITQRRKICNVESWFVQLHEHNPLTMT